jgi:hypothetical protein
MAPEINSVLWLNLSCETRNKENTSQNVILRVMCTGTSDTTRSFTFPALNVLR